MLKRLINRLEDFFNNFNDFESFGLFYCLKKTIKFAFFNIFTYYNFSLDCLNNKISNKQSFDSGIVHFYEEHFLGLNKDRIKQKKQLLEFISLLNNNI